MTLVTQNGNTIEQGLHQLFRRLQAYLNQRSGKLMSQGLSDAIRAHFIFNWPGSKYLDPNKVKAGQGDRNEGTAVVAIPGISRAYNDIDIYPKTKQALTIPMHREAFGRKAADFDDLFVVRKNDGKAFLARNNGGNLTMMFFLAKHVHQRKNSKLMPTDD